MSSEYNNPTSPGSYTNESDLEGGGSNHNVNRNITNPTPTARVPKKGVSFFGIQHVEETDNNEEETPEVKKPRKVLNKKGSFAGLGSFFSSMRSESSYESGVLSAAEEGENNGLGTRNTSTRKVQFHQAKKLTRAASQHYLKFMNDTKAAKFENWSKAELIRLLVEDKHYELIDEENIDVVALRDLSENLYEDQKTMPRKPQPYSIFDIVLRNVMARRIQNAWFGYLEYKVLEAERRRNRVLQRRLGNLRSSIDLTGLNEDDIYHLNCDQQIIVGGNTIDIETGENTIPLEFFDELTSSNALEDPVLSEEGESPSMDIEDHPIVSRDLGLSLDPNDPNKQSSSKRKPKVKINSAKDTNTSVVTGPKKRIKNILDIPWTPPDISKAQKYADYVQPRKGGKGGEIYNLYDTHTGRHCCLGSCGEQFDLWKEGKVSEFSIYGSGVTNYFKFMKWGFWLFLLLSIVALPELVLNNLASTYNNAIQGNRGLKELARNSVGNLAYAFQNGTLSINIPGCHSDGIYHIGCNLHGRDLSMLYAILDIVICGIILIAFIWLSVFETEEERELNKSNISVSMYSISVSNLPLNVNEMDLINHFTKLAGYPESVAAVSIAYDNVEEFEECKSRGRIIHEKIRLVHELRYKATRIRELADSEGSNTGNNTGNTSSPTPIPSQTTSNTNSDTNTTSYTDSIIQRQEKAKVVDVEINIELEKFYNAMKNLNLELSNKDKKLATLASQPTCPIYAFITFNKVADRKKIEKAYNQMSWYEYLFKYKPYLLDGKFLKVRPAPEPSVIIWENLMYSYYDRIRRRCLTTFAAFLLVIISVIMIFSSKYLEQRAQNNGSKTKTSCPNDWDNYSELQKQDYVMANSESLHCYCDQLDTLSQSTDSYCQHYLQENIQSQVLVYFASFVVLIVNTLMEKLLRFLSSYEKHHTSDSKEKSIFIRMFILKYINTAAVFLINNNNVILNQIYGLNAKGSPEFTANWFNTVGVTIILVQLGDLMNGHMDTFIQFIFYHWKRKQAVRDHNKPTKPIANTTSTTAMTTNTNNNPSSQVLGGGNNTADTTTTSPSPSSFESSQVSIKKKPAGKNVAYTQDLLNKMFVGPEFEFSINYSKMITTVFVCLTFSTGIPLLYPIAAINFGIFYLSEKFFFVRMYKIPPHFNSLVGQMVTKLVPFALLVHIVMAMWILSNDGLFGNSGHHTTTTTTSSTTAIDQASYYYGGNSNNFDYPATSVQGFRERLVNRITGYATFPLFIALLLVAAVIVIMYVTQSVTMGLEKMYYFIFGCCRNTNTVGTTNATTNGRTTAQQNNTAYDRTYTNAMRRSLFKGLATYNILQNPVYKEAFGITWKFAVDNKDVRSVRLLQLRAEETADEVDAARIEQLKIRAAIKNAPNGSSDSPGKNMKNIARNRSFFNSFYQPPQDDHMITTPTPPTTATPNSSRKKKEVALVPLTTPTKGSDSNKKSMDEQRPVTGAAESHKNRALPTIPSQEQMMIINQSQPFNKGRPPIVPGPPPPQVVSPPPYPTDYSNHGSSNHGSSNPNSSHGGSSRKDRQHRERGHNSDRSGSESDRSDRHHKHRHRSDRDRGGERGNNSGSDRGSGSERDRHQIPPQSPQSPSPQYAYPSPQQQQQYPYSPHQSQQSYPHSPQQQQHYPPPTYSQQYPPQYQQYPPPSSQQYPPPPQPQPPSQHQSHRDYPPELDADGFQKHSFLLYNDSPNKQHHQQHQTKPSPRK